MSERVANKLILPASGPPSRWIVVVLAQCLLVLLPSGSRADTVAELLAKAKAALAGEQPDEAARLAGLAISAEPKNVDAYLLRAAAYSALGRQAEAVADYDRLLAIEPKTALAYDRRGSEHFKLGHMDKAIDDFDRFLRFHPEEEPGHWRRGIAYYYAGRYQDGAKQFKGYEQVDTNDVENAVWRFLCMARSAGIREAQSGMLKIGNDSRVPMMQVYELFQGRSRPQDVLAAVDQGKPSATGKNQRLFLAHLYLGLYYDVQGDKQNALDHITKATENHKSGGYMGDVARVHLAALKNGNNR
jgi:lipoprotein NlpI